MIFGIIGFFILIFSTMKDTGVSVGGIIAGVVLILLGISTISWKDEKLTARMNRRKYWANKK